MKNIVILGSTGSIGKNALDIIAKHPDRFRVVGLAAGGNVALIREQIKRFKPKIVALFEHNAGKELKKEPGIRGVKILSGMEGVVEVATIVESDMILSSIVGAAGLLPTLAAIKSGKDIGLANKESLVIAGELVMKAARAHNVRIIPVDSEHSAIFQSICGASGDYFDYKPDNSHPIKKIKQLILTGSGGPFRDFPKEKLSKVQPSDALKHPNWSMGQKITIDSSTMMNKGFEVIEAKWLFNIKSDRIKVVVHPQSIIHSMVEYVDSSIIAQLGLPDMRLPISYALNYPDRTDSSLPSLDLTEINNLTFEKPDLEKFPCLRYAYEAIDKGDSYPAVLNASNEVAVHSFINGDIPFTAIPETIARVVNAHKPFKLEKVPDVLKADHWGREMANEYIGKYYSPIGKVK